MSDGSLRAEAGASEGAGPEGGSSPGEERLTGETDAGQGCGSEGGGSLRGAISQSGKAVFRRQCGCKGEMTEGVSLGSQVRGRKGCRSERKGF